jgi:hypothetical protein
MVHKMEQTVDSRTSLRPPLRRAVSRDPLKDLPLNDPTNLNPARLGISPDPEPKLVLAEWSPLTLLPRHVMFSGEPSTQPQRAITHNQNPRQSVAPEPALREMVAGMLPDLLWEFVNQPAAQPMNGRTPDRCPDGQQRGPKRPRPTSVFAAQSSQPAWGPQSLGASVPTGQSSGVISATSDREAVRRVVAEELERLMPSAKRARLGSGQQPQHHRI